MPKATTFTLKLEPELHDAFMAEAHPRLGRPGRVPGTREPVVSGTPFIAAYRIEDDTIVVLHGAQRWPSTL